VVGDVVGGVVIVVVGAGGAVVGVGWLTPVCRADEMSDAISVLVLAF
jgi:hypothetical protein